MTLQELLEQLGIVQRQKTLPPSRDERLARPELRGADPIRPSISVRNMTPTDERFPDLMSAVRAVQADPGTRVEAQRIYAPARREGERGIQEARDMLAESLADVERVQRMRAIAGLDPGPGGPAPNPGRGADAPPPVPIVMPSRPITDQYRYQPPSGSVIGAEVGAMPPQARDPLTAIQGARPPAPVPAPRPVQVAQAPPAPAPEPYPFPSGTPIIEPSPFPVGTSVAPAEPFPFPVHTPLTGPAVDATPFREARLPPGDVYPPDEMGFGQGGPSPIIGAGFQGAPLNPRPAPTQPPAPFIAEPPIPFDAALEGVPANFQVGPASAPKPAPLRAAPKPAPIPPSVPPKVVQQPNIPATMGNDIPEHLKEALLLEAARISQQNRAKAQANAGR